MRLLPRRLMRVLVLLAALVSFALPHAAAVRRKPVPKKSLRAMGSKSILRQARTLRLSTKKKRPSRLHKVFNPWRVPSFANSTVGDTFDGDDGDAREAAVEALGRFNGTVVVSEAETGKVLTIVNQKLALQNGFQPCSTVKLPVALAALRELVIDRTDKVRVGRRMQLDLTTALAVSNNAYFAKLGGELGFDRVTSYARMLGFGEKAGMEIEGEKAGTLPREVPSSGIGMMTSFGDGIRVTPLELSALVGAIANGGTLFYLQYPKTLEEMEAFEPQVKRQLDIGEAIPDVLPGMMGAVEFGTARRAQWAKGGTIYGKTGTCTDSSTPTHLGWFSSFGEIDGEKIVVTVLLTGGSAVNGPAASGVAGEVYRRLRDASDDN